MIHNAVYWHKTDLVLQLLEICSFLSHHASALLVYLGLEFELLGFLQAGQLDLLLLTKLEISAILNEPLVMG